MSQCKCCFSVRYKGTELVIVVYSEAIQSGDNLITGCYNNLSRQVALGSHDIDVKDIKYIIT